MKYGVIMTLILALILVWYFTREKPLSEFAQERSTNAVQVTAKVPVTIELPEEQTKEPEIPQKQSKKTNLPQSQNSESELLPEGQHFHQDPLMDTFMGLVEYSMCQKLFSDEASEQEQMAALNTEQLDLLLPHFDSCEEQSDLAEQYSPNQMMNQLGKIAQDPEGFERIQDMFFGSEPYTAAQVVDIYAEISQLSGMELLITTTLYKRFVEQEIVPKVKVELQAHDIDMVEYVIQQASFLMACDRGANCTANSPIMYNICFYNSQACGMDLYTFVDTQYTPGIRNEILITKNYLLSLFSFQ